MEKKTTARKLGNYVATWAAKNIKKGTPITIEESTNTITITKKGSFHDTFYFAWKII